VSAAGQWLWATAISSPGSFVELNALAVVAGTRVVTTGFYKNAELVLGALPALPVASRETLLVVNLDASTGAVTWAQCSIEHLTGGLPTSPGPVIGYAVVDVSRNVSGYCMIAGGFRGRHIIGNADLNSQNVERPFVWGLQEDGTIWYTSTNFSSDFASNRFTSMALLDDDSMMLAANGEVQDLSQVAKGVRLSKFAYMTNTWQSTNNLHFFTANSFCSDAQLATQPDGTLVVTGKYRGSVSLDGLTVLPSASTDRIFFARVTVLPSFAVNWSLAPT